MPRSIPEVLDPMFAIIALIIAGAAVLSQTAPFPFLMEAFRPSRSLWHVDSPRGSPPTVYLTFDDGPNPLWTPALLDALGETNVRGTFFLIDDYITPETEPIVRRIAEDGHAIGLHSKTRKLMILPPDELAGRLQDASDRIVSITGVEPCRLFRPHGGWRSATMYQGLERIGYRLAGWTWGLWDFDWWRTPRADQVVPRLVDGASAGDIIVIHDGHHKNPRADRRHAPETVRRLVPELRARGFRFERLCEMGGSRVFRGGLQWCPRPNPWR